MADIKQIPATLNLYYTAGDGLRWRVSVGIDLTGYTFATLVDGEAVEVEVEPFDLSQGKFDLVIQPGGPAVNSRWHLTWTPPSGMVRTAFAGAIFASKP